MRRTRVARLPIMYAAIQIGRTEIDTPRSLYQRDANGIVTGKPEMKALVNSFVEGCVHEKVKLDKRAKRQPGTFPRSIQSHLYQNGKNQ